MSTTIEKLTELLAQKTEAEQNQEKITKLVMLHHEELGRLVEAIPGLKREAFDAIGQNIAETAKKHADETQSAMSAHVAGLAVQAQKTRDELKAELNRLGEAISRKATLSEIGAEVDRRAYLAAMNTLKTDHAKEVIKAQLAEAAAPLFAALAEKDSGFIELYRGVFKTGTSQAKRGELWSFYGNTFLCTGDTSMAPKFLGGNQTSQNWALIAASGAPGAPGAGGSGSTTVTDVWVIAIGDETTAITTGTAKVTFRAPRAATVTAVRASLTTASSSGTPTFDINEGGASILSTLLTIDANEKTSTTAATPAVISDSAIADDAEITIDIDTAGTGAAGAKVSIYVTY